MEWVILAGGCFVILLIIWLVTGLVFLIKNTFKGLYILFVRLIPKAFGHICSGAIQKVFGGGFFGKLVATGLFAALTALFVVFVIKPYLLYYKINLLRLWEFAVPIALASFWFWCRQYYYVLLQAENPDRVAECAIKCFNYLYIGAICSALVALISAYIDASWPLWPPILTGFAIKSAFEWKISIEMDSLKEDFLIDPSSTKSAIVDFHAQERAKRLATNHYY